MISEIMLMGHEAKQKSGGLFPVRLQWKTSLAENGRQNDMNSLY